MDGFGVSAENKGNAVAAAKKPTLDMLDAAYPFTTLQASGIAVGLPWGEAGNSEVGHLTMGAGRVIYHSLPRIINAIHDGSFFKNEAFLKAAEHVNPHTYEIGVGVKSRNSRLHILGLASSGSVHSYIDHLCALLKFTEISGVPQTFLHVITDGKDAPPKEGEKFIAQLEERMVNEWPHAKIGSVMGRFYAMDRDEKWDRVKKAYELLTEGAGNKIEGTISQYLRLSYDKGLTDESIEPGFMVGPRGKPLATINDGDAIIIFNFREDSVREITHAFVDNAFDHFPRKKVLDLLVTTMTEYERDMSAETAFPTLSIDWPLARIISDAGFRQLHIAESEKYAHVTYFFNGGREKPYPNEERILVPSVATMHFDDMPEMKSAEITAKVLEELPRHDFILVNFANTDMVGHSGNLDAAVKAVEAVDRAVGELYQAVIGQKGIMIVAGDHGNAEAKRNMITGEKLTEHSLNPVPMYLVGEDFRLPKTREASEILAKKKEIGGILTDIAPTILELMGLGKPTEMTGSSLLTELTREHFHQGR